MQRRNILILAVVLVVIVVAGVLIVRQAIIGGTGSYARSHASGTPSDLTGVQSFSYDHSDRLAGASLQLQFDVEAGSVHWRFTDPEGEVRWEGDAVAGDQVDERQEFPPLAGLWHLDLDMQGFTGRYDTSWEGHD
ncbi:MAG: hypothetical protein JW910_04120 [Anaerolineae bacterium]|nr:hypothetical protein [Anaerolineae bacterium]